MLPFKTYYNITKLFESDKQLLAFAGKVICMAHLDAVKRAYSVDDWVTFLKQPDRLRYALLLAKPFSLLDQSILDGDKLSWSDIYSSMWGIGSDLWPTNDFFELRISARLRELDRNWLEEMCWEDPHGEDALKILNQYEDIKRLAFIEYAH